MTTPTPYPLSAVRALALHAQRLTARQTTATATKDDLYRTVEQLGAVQIDTLQMIHRSQYVALWSRLGRYDPGDLDRLAYDPDDRRLFEYWWHAACYIPLSEYRYVLPVMRWYANGGGTRNPTFLAKQGSKQVLKDVQQRIREEGALRAADFDDPRKQRGTWWDWKPAKRALEFLYDHGDLMVAGRVNFQRVYDLTGRVLPDWVDTTDPGEEEALRYKLERSVRAFGICSPAQASDTFSHIKRGEARETVEALMQDGTFATVQAVLADGETHVLIVHRDDLALLAQAADGALSTERTTFLSPFDSLFWAQGRDTLFWNFRQVLEAYKPAAQREWGYFCLPILHRDALVGRFDPKLERKTGTLRLKALYLEPGVDLTEELVAGVASATQDFLRFHDAAELVIERSQPSSFGQKLMHVL